jgi:hypothetical protein
MRGSRVKALTLAAARCWSKTRLIGGGGDLATAWKEAGRVKAKGERIKTIERSMGESGGKP